MLGAGVQELTAFLAIASAIAYLVFRYTAPNQKRCEGCSAAPSDPRPTAVRHRLPLVPTSRAAPVAPPPR